MTRADFVQKLTDTFKKTFSNSWFEISKGALSSNDSIYIRYTYGAKKDWKNQILQNDNFFTVMSIHGIPEGDISQSKLSFEMSTGNRADMGDPSKKLGDKPQKIGWRNKQGAPDKLVKHFEEYLKKTKEVISKRKDMA